MAHRRVLQWSVLARTWWLYDATGQCAYRSAEKLTCYLEGRHKPLYHPLSDIGDHVVVINSKHVAMADELWRKESFFHDSRHVGGKSEVSAWKLHEYDPTMLMYKAVKRAGPKTLQRPNQLRRLHIYPDDNVPDHIMNNVSDVIRQIQVVPKTLQEYTQEEIDAFPKLFDWPEDHVLFKRNTMEEQLHEQRLLQEESKNK